MNALVRVLALTMLGASACGSTDVIAYRAFARCLGPSCPPLDDAGSDAAAAAGPSGPCAAAVCTGAIACAAPVPRVIVGDGCGDQPWAAPGFRYALCSCEDFVSAFPLTVERAVNGLEHGAASVAVDDDFTAGADVSITGQLLVSGALVLVDRGNVAAQDVQSETASPRCDCSGDVVLTPAAVLALVPSNPAGFDAERFGRVETDETIALDCGAYRVPRIAGSSGLRLAISGHVVLVVEGDVQIDGNLEATLAEGALLELFVLGNLRVDGALLLGDDDDRVRTYVLGAGTIDVSAETFLAGPLYAPNAELVTRGELTTMGSVFVRRAAPGGAVVIRYDSAASHAVACQGSQ